MQHSVAASSGFVLVETTRSRSGRTMETRSSYRAALKVSFGEHAWTVSPGSGFSACSVSISRRDYGTDSKVPRGVL